MEEKIKIVSREEYLKGLAAELKKDGLQVAIKKRCDEIEGEARQAKEVRWGYANWGYITEMLLEIIDLAEITEQKPCEYIGNGTLKKRGKGFVCYNVEWFKKHWRQELDLMGIELEADKAEQEEKA